LIIKKHTAISSKSAFSTFDRLLLELRKQTRTCSAAGKNLLEIDTFLKRIAPLVPNKVQNSNALYTAMAPLGWCTGLSESCSAIDLLIRLEDITTVGLALLVVNGAANQGISTLSMPALRAYDNALQGLHYQESEDPGVISRVNTILFQSLPLIIDINALSDLRDGVLSEFRLRKQGILHDSIHVLMRAMIAQSPVPDTVFNHDFIVEDDDFFENDKALLRSVASAFFNPLEPTPSGQWLQLACLNYRISDPLVLSFLASGPSGDALDQLLTQFSERRAPLKASFAGFIAEIRRRQSGGTDAELRFLEAEKRVGAVVETVLKYRVTTAQSDKIIQKISSWEQGLADVCSVGYDLQLLDFDQEIKSILAPTASISNEVPSLSALAVAFQTNIMTVLFDIGVPLGLHTDVHHLNLVLTLFMEHRGMAVPATLQDPDRPGFQTLVEQKKDLIFSCLNRSDLLLKYIDRSGDMSQLGAVLNGLVAQGMLSIEDRFSNLTLDQIEDFSLALFKLDDAQLYAVFPDMTTVDGFHEFLKTKGLIHGVVGLAARVGAEAVFTRTFDHVTLKTPSDVEDIRGMNLLEYAVLGGELAVYTRVFESLPNTFRLIDFFESRIDAKGRTLFALAAESGRVEIVDSLCQLLDDQSKQPLYMSAADREGYTPLMRAAMGGNRELVQRFLKPMCPLDAVNVYGQTALHLAVNFGTVDTVDVLLNSGMLSRYATIPSSGFNGFHLAILRDDMAIIERLAKVRCYNIDDGIAAKDRAGIRPFEYAKNGNAVLPFLRAAVRWSNDYFRDGFSQNPFVKYVRDVASLALHSGKLTAEDWLSCIDFSVEKNIPIEALVTVIWTAVLSRTLQKDQIIQSFSHLPCDASVLNGVYTDINLYFCERFVCLGSGDEIVAFCQFWNTVNDSFGAAFGDSWHYPVARLMRHPWSIRTPMEFLFNSLVFSTDTLLTIVKRLGQEVPAEWFFEGCASAIKTQKLNQEQLKTLIDGAREILDDNAFLKIEAIAWDYGFQAEATVIDDEDGTILDRIEETVDSVLDTSNRLSAVADVSEAVVDTPKGCCVVS